MAVESWPFTATIPAGTPATSPAVTAMTMPVRIIESVSWRVPPGPVGLMGFRLTMGAVQVIPTAGGDLWVIASGEAGSYRLDNLPESGAWQLTGYNTGLNPHSVFITFHVGLPRGRRPPPAPLDLSALVPVPDLSAAGPPLGALWPS